jgi:hypothetical protein
VGDHVVAVAGVAQVGVCKSPFIFILDKASLK